MDKPIRVAQIMGSMGSGGVESVVMNYYRNIDRSKIQFDFIVDEDSTLPQKEEIESLGGRIIVVPPYQKINKYLKELKRLFKENNYNIVHSHINTLSVFPLYMAKKCNVPVRIAHSHSTAGKGEWKRNVMKYALRPFSKMFSTDYYACTSYAGEWLFGKKTFEKKGVVINNGIDVEKFAYDEKTRKDLRKELNIEDKFVIGHIGRFMKQKNQEFIVDIFNEVQKQKDDAVLLFVGEGSLKETVIQKVKDYEIEDKVIFLEPRQDINRVYQAIDLFLFPSLYEGLGIVLVEAQVAGLPSVSSDVVPIDAKVCDLVTFINLSMNAKHWADECLELCKVERKSYIKEAKEHGFDIVKEAKKLERLYLK